MDKRHDEICRAHVTEFALTAELIWRNVYFAEQLSHFAKNEMLYQNIIEYTYVFDLVHWLLKSWSQ